MARESLRGDSVEGAAATVVLAQQPKNGSGTRGSGVALSESEASDDIESDAITSFFADNAKVSQGGRRGTPHKINTDGFFKGLIDFTGLRNAWEQISKRLSAMEARQGTLDFLTHEQLQQDFVTRLEYSQKVETEHTDSLNESARRHDTLAATVEGHAGALNENQVSLEELFKRMGTGEERIDHAAKCLERLEKRVEEVAKVDLVARRELEKQLGRANKDIGALRSSLRKQELHAEELAETLRQQKEFIEQGGLTGMINSLCHSIVDEYSENEEARRAIEAEKLENTLTKHHSTIGELWVALDVSTQKFTDRALGQRVDQLENQVKSSFAAVWGEVNNKEREEEIKRATKGLETLGQQFDKYAKEAQCQLQDMASVTNSRLKDIMQHVADLRTVGEDHEHALEHHAEEMVNRCTKFDLLMISHRIDRCALQDEMKTGLDSLRAASEWQSKKLEEVASVLHFREASRAVESSLSGRRPSSLSGRRPESRMSVLQTEAELPSLVELPESVGHEATQSTVERANDGTTEEAALDQEVTGADGHRQLQRAAESEEKAGHAQSEASLVSFAGTQRSQAAALPKGTEMQALAIQQLESLAQGTLELGRLALRSGGGCPQLTREMRQEREAELMHHLSSVLLWIRHRLAPGGWDPARLTTLAASALIEAPGDKPAAPPARPPGPTRAATPAGAGTFRRGLGKASSVRRSPDCALSHRNSAAVAATASARCSHVPQTGPVLGIGVEPIVPEAGSSLSAESSTKAEAGPLAVLTSTAEAVSSHASHSPSPQSPAGSFIEPLTNPRTVVKTPDVGLPALPPAGSLKARSPEQDPRSRPRAASAGSGGRRSRTLQTAQASAETKSPPPMSPPPIVTESLDAHPMPVTAPPLLEDGEAEAAAPGVSLAPSISSSGPARNAVTSHTTI